MFSKIKELLLKNEKIGIAVGKNPTIDEMGAALGLYLSLKGEAKDVSICSPTEPIVEISSLVGIDKVKNSFNSASGNLTVSFPYKEGEIEKISYTLEEGKLNILVKAGHLGLSFNEKDIAFKRAGGAPNLIFVIGTPRISDLGEIFDPQALKDTTVVNIDNKADNQGYGDIVLVSTKLSSVSEEVANLLFSLEMKLDVDSASNLLAGISIATNNFQNPSTSSLAFEMAGLLMKNGAARANGQRKHNLIKEQSFQPLTKKTDKSDTTPPDDWLAPKIYKGSTLV